jgi:hypothetical protein
MKEKQTWDLPLKEEEKILTLQAEVSLLKKRNGKSKAGKLSRKKRENEGRNQNNQGNRKNKFKGKNQKVTQPKPEWMSSKPKKEQLKEPKGVEWVKMVVVWCRDRRKMRSCSMESSSPK